MKFVGTVIKRIAFVALLVSISWVDLCVAEQSSKPVILIAGEGNATVNSTGTVVGGYRWATGLTQSTISKHNQTMEMAQDFLQYCPTLQVTVDQTAIPDYYVALNREGGAYNIGQSQVILLNRRKVVIFVAKKGTVKNAVRSTCNAIGADWQTNGRLAIAAPALVTISPNMPSTKADAAESVGAPLNVKATTVALEMQTTAAAQTRCKPQTITDVMSDTTAYLTSKSVAIGTAGDASYTLTLIVDRPVTKWIKITVQDRDSKGSLLWSEEVSDGGMTTTHLGTKGTLNALDKIHQIIDRKLGAENGLPLLTAAPQPAATPTSK